MRKSIRFSLIFEIVLSIAMGIVLFAAAPHMISIFMDEKEIITAGALMMRCQLLSAPFIAVSLVFTVVFQSAGKALSATVLSLSRQGIVLAVCMIVLSYLFQYYGVICAQPLSDGVTAVIAAVLYLHLCKTELIV